MPKNAPSGPPKKSDEQATLSIEIPAKVLMTFIRTVAWIVFLCVVVALLINGIDPTVLMPFAPRL